MGPGRFRSAGDRRAPEAVTNSAADRSIPMSLDRGSCAPKKVVWIAIPCLALLATGPPAYGQIGAVGLIGLDASPTEVVGGTRFALILNIKYNSLYDLYYFILNNIFLHTLTVYQTYF